jgi:hypothetical protein
MADLGMALRSDLNRVSFSATNHCLTGCVAGEITGMAIGTALGWGNLPTIVLAVALAFVFGYSLTSIPLFRAGLALGTVVTTALAADTVSIAIMETVDNLAMAFVPGAMDEGLDSGLFWLTLLGGFVLAYPFAFSAQRYLIARGRGHAHVHARHGH